LHPGSAYQAAPVTLTKSKVMTRPRKRKQKIRGYVGENPGKIRVKGWDASRGTVFSPC
jgi:hypothetical protein